MDGRRIDVHVHVHVHWEALFMTCGVRHIEVRRAKVLIKVLIVLILELVLVEVVHAVLELQSLAGEPVDGAGNELLLDVLTELVVKLELLLDVLVNLLVVV